MVVYCSKEALSMHPTQTLRTDFIKTSIYHKLVIIIIITELKSFQYKRIEFLIKKHNF